MFEDLTGEVQLNCDRADARYAQNFGLCSYLLRMREYYRWKMGFDFLAKLDPKEITPWVMDQEDLWEELEEEAFAPLTLPSGKVDPFAAEAVNEELVQEGLVYGGGLGPSGRPLFFLAELVEARDLDGVKVLITGKERARGMMAPPALSRADHLYVRMEALKDWLWGKYEEWAFHQEGSLAKRAFAHYPFATDPVAALEAMAEKEREVMIRHELGETELNRIWGDAWHEMILDLIPTKAEHILRGIRDLAADCRSTLPYLIERGERASLDFFFFNLTGLRKQLDPVLFSAYESYVEGGDFQGLLEASRKGAERWFQEGSRFLELYRTQGKAVRQSVEEAFLVG